MDRYCQFTMTMPLQAAGTSEVRRQCFELPGRWYIERCAFVGDAVTADNTDYTAIEFKNVTQDEVILLHTTTITGDGSLVAGTRYTTGFSESGEDLVVQQGDVFTLSKTDSGSGKAWEGSASLYLRQLQGG